MSVIIKGVNIPKTCGECVFLVERLIYPCWCCAGDFAIKPSETDLRDGICPLVEMPAPEEFAREMRECGDGTDEEVIHASADELMCNVLRALGYEEGVRVFEELPKWYS